MHCFGMLLASDTGWVIETENWNLGDRDLRDIEKLANKWMERSVLPRIAPAAPPLRDSAFLRQQYAPSTAHIRMPYVSLTWHVSVIHVL